MSTLIARPSLTKARPAYDGYTGAMLREALEALGIVYHVDKPWRDLPMEYVVCSVPGRARVWISCVAGPSARTLEGRRFSDHYDLPAVALWAVAATVTDDEGTQFVYNGFGDEHKPTAPAGIQAGQCAAAVAEHFGLTLPEPEPVCVHCGRGIEWIEDDGQGAWCDSSHWIGCVSGETLHAPEPLCGSCEDYGLITHYDRSTDGITGHSRCDNAPCVARAEKRAAEYERRRAAEEAEAAAHVCADHLCCPPF
ncbi:hypothetical protein [Streptomyces sp. NPDC056160]|uniref:hypothetical protein n=1 Tax=Streptomyces sp. NPDC056160 TaxID=3345731 RepID=UPI0035E3186B